MRVGIATDHGGFVLKEELVGRLHEAGYEVVDFGAHARKADDDYPDYVIPLAKAVASRQVTAGIAICGSGVGASVCANKIAGARAALIHDHFLCSPRGGRRPHERALHGRSDRRPSRRVDLVQTFLGAQASQAERHLRRLGKVAALEKPQ